MPLLDVAAFLRALDDNGASESGAKLYVYENGTTTPVTTYSDVTLQTEQANPVVANSGGQFASIYVAADVYRVRLTDSAGTTIEEADDIVIRNLDATDVTVARFTTVSNLIADNSLGYSAGGSVTTVVSAGGYVEADLYRYVILAEGASDPDVTTSGGVKLDVQMGPDGRKNAFAFNAKGDGVTDDASALTTAIDYPAILLPDGDFLVNSALVAEDNLVSLVGVGWHLKGGAAETLSGSSIEAPSSVANTLTVQSNTPSSGSSTRASRVTLSNFNITHRGTGAGLTIDNVIRPHLSDLRVDCDNTGATGITLDNHAFFSVMERVRVRNFTDTGIIIDGDGSQHVLKDCHISAGTTANATAALELRRFDFIVEGGQIDCNRTDNAGIGILVNNTDGSATRTGGRISNVICENDIAIKITGDTFAFDNVYVFQPFWSLGNVTTGIVFDRANGCVLDRPLVDSPTGGGTLAEWTANSTRCGVITGYQGARAPLTVDASATDPWMRVIDRVAYTNRTNITTDANLTVTIDDCEYVGQTQHNGVAWDKYWAFITDDGVDTFDVPFSGGVIEIVTRNDAEADGSVSFIKSSNDTRDLRGGVRLEKNDTTLTGTTGNDGVVTIGLSGQQLHVENRSGSDDNFLIVYRGRTTA